MSNNMLKNYSPIDLMSDRVLLKFLPLFDKNLKSLSEADFSAQTGNKKAMDPKSILPKRRHNPLG